MALPAAASQSHGVSVQQLLNLLAQPAPSGAAAARDASHVHAVIDQWILLLTTAMIICPILAT